MRVRRHEVLREDRPKQAQGAAHDAGTQCPGQHASPSRRATGVPWGAWGVIDLQNFRRSQWKPSLDAAGIQPRRIYDMRHSFATWALDAGLSIFDLSRYMGTSVEMIDRTYGHLAQGAEQSAQAMLDGLRSSFGPRSGHGRKRGGRPEAAIPHEQSSGRWGSNPRPSAWEAHRALQSTRR